jgi:hypothetical protein
MIVYLLINKSNLTIEDLHVEIPAIPYEECLDTRDAVASLKGLKIARGFTSRVKALIGGVKGCNHLATLLTAMGAPAIQGWGVWRKQQSPDLSAHMTPDVFRILIDNCRIWREGGPLVNSVRKRLEEKEEDQILP